MSVPDWTQVREQIARKLAEDRQMVERAQQQEQTAEDIPDLIKWLAAEHHEGRPTRMHKTLGVSEATPNFWARGVVLPSTDSVVRLCKVYDLALQDVMELWRRSRSRRGK